MFEFMSMFGNYESRKIGRYDSDDLSVSTARVNDGNQPFETGVMHPDYNDGKWIIVDAYDTAEEAKEGHEMWVKIMTSDELPDTLEDCNNSKIQQLCTAMGEKPTFKRVKK